MFLPQCVQSLASVSDLGQPVLQALHFSSLLLLLLQHLEQPGVHAGEDLEQTLHRGVAGDAAPAGRVAPHSVRQHVDAARHVAHQLLVFGLDRSILSLLKCLALRVQRQRRCGLG